MNNPAQLSPHTKFKYVPVCWKNNWIIIKLLLYNKLVQNTNKTSKCTQIEAALKNRSNNLSWTESLSTMSLEQYYKTKLTNKNKIQQK